MALRAIGLEQFIGMIRYAGLVHEQIPDRDALPFVRNLREVRCERRIEAHSAGIDKLQHRRSGECLGQREYPE